MDRGRTRAGLLTRSAAVLINVGAWAGALADPVAVSSAPLLRAMQWMAPADRLTALTRRPAECAAPLPETDLSSFEVGHVAFQTPVLLGGQAARAGLACESCHRGGRDNPAFLFPGLSAAPGTADVTSSLLSSHRGNGVFDPRPIPDLAKPGKISRDPQSADLRRFIRGLVVEEFDGAELPTRVLDGLATYVRAQSAAPCPTTTVQEIGVALYLDDIRRATAAAIDAWRDGDPPAARLMLSGARTALGLLDERFALPGLEADRRGLRNADSGILAVQLALDRGDGDIDVRLAAWNAASTDWSPGLRREEAQSLFNAGILRAAYSLPP